MYIRMTQGEYATKVVYRGYGLTYILLAIAEGNLQCVKAEQFLDCAICLASGQYHKCIPHFRIVLKLWLCNHQAILQYYCISAQFSLVFFMCFVDSTEQGTPTTTGPSNNDYFSPLSSLAYCP